MTDDVLDPARDTTTDNRPEYPKVGDDENIAQKRSHQRIQAILDEITNIKIAEANDVENEIPPLQHREAYHKAVCELWRELQPMLEEATDETEKYYWHRINLGEVRVEPPAPLAEPESRLEAEARPDLLPGASWAETVIYEIKGFDTYVRMDTTIRTRFEVRFVESEITPRELKQRINRDDPDGAYKVYERGDDYREPFRVDKETVLPEKVIDDARAALRELAEKVEVGFGKPDHVDSRETEEI